MILFETKEERSENSHLLSMKNEAVSPPVGSMSRIPNGAECNGDHLEYPSGWHS
jgi:hypothetical protein